MSKVKILERHNPVMYEAIDYAEYDMYVYLWNQVSVSRCAFGQEHSGGVKSNP